MQAEGKSSEEERFLERTEPSLGAGLSLSVRRKHRGPQRQEEGREGGGTGF